MLEEDFTLVAGSVDGNGASWAGVQGGSIPWDRFFHRLQVRGTSFDGSTSLGLESEAARSPSMRAPRAPVFTRIESGERRITLDWALSSDPDIAGYRLYRASSIAELEELRWFGEARDPRLVATIEDPLIRARGSSVRVPEALRGAILLGAYRLDEFDRARPSEPQAAFNYLSAASPAQVGAEQPLRPISEGTPLVLVYRAAEGSVSATARRRGAPPFVDTGVPVLRDAFYRLVAFDSAGNVSEGSAVVAARAPDPSLPEALPLSARWAGGARRQARLTWNLAWETLLQRRAAGHGTWTSLTGWLPPGAYELLDVPGAAEPRWEYRLWARNAAGQIARGAAVSLDGR